MTGNHQKLTVVVIGPSWCMCALSIHFIIMIHSNLPTCAMATWQVNVWDHYWKWTRTLNLYPPVHHSKEIVQIAEVRVSIRAKLRRSTYWFRFLLVSVISIIDYILHQLLKCRCQKEPVQYNKIMKLNTKYMSTPAQVRYNVNGMINRLQQRRKSCSNESWKIINSYSQSSFRKN